MFLAKSYCDIGNSQSSSSTVTQDGEITTTFEYGGIQCTPRAILYGSYLNIIEAVWALPHSYPHSYPTAQEGNICNKGYDFVCKRDNGDFHHSLYRF